MNKERREGTSNRKTWMDEEEDNVWWDWKGIVHYKLLSSNQLIPNSTVNNCRDYNKQLRGNGQN